jgi:hypothetical protein
MTVSKEKTLAEINADAVRVLCREIGIVNTLKFINQYTHGFGDYTEERKQMFKDETLDSLVEQINQQKKE